MSKLTIEIDREDDGRWIADIPAIPGVTVYGDTREAAIINARTLALRVIADFLEHGEPAPDLTELFEVAAAEEVAA